MQNISTFTWSTLYSYYDDEDENETGEAVEREESECVAMENDAEVKVDVEVNNGLETVERKSAEDDLEADGGGGQSPEEEEEESNIVQREIEPTGWSKWPWTTTVECVL